MEPQDPQAQLERRAASGDRQIGEGQSSLRPFPKFHLLAFLSLAVLVALFVAFDLRTVHRHTLAYWDILLSNAAEQRIDVITLWLNQRKTDVEVISATPSAIDLLAGGKNGSDSRRTVERELERMTRFSRFSGGVLVDNECRILAQAGVLDNRAASLEETCRAVRTKPGFHVIASGLERGEMRLNLAEPVWAAGDQGTVLGAVILVSDPWKAMSAFLRPEIGPARSIEMLLVWRRAPEIIIFAPYRKAQDQAALFRKPLKEPDFETRVANSGDAGFEEFVDYRGVPVFGVGRRIQASGDNLVLKVDREEALSEYFQRVLWEVLAGVLSIGFFGFVIATSHRASSARELREKLRLLELQHQAAVSNARFRQLFENTGDIVVTYDLQGRILSMNRAAERVSGYSQDEALKLKLNVSQTLAPEYQDSFRQAVERLSAGEAPSVREVEIIAKDGRRVVIEGVSQLVREGDQPVSLQVIARDISERKRAEEALRQSELRYRALVEHAPEAIVVIDVGEGRMVDCNENAVRLFGLSREELIKVGPAQMSPPLQPDGRSSAEAARDYRTQALQGKTPVFEWTHRDSSGRCFACEVRLARMPSDRPLLRASITDITERKRTEQALRESEERFRQLSEASFEGIAFTENGKILHANARLAEMVGWDLKDLVGAHVADLVAPESMDLVMAKVRTAEEKPYEHMALRKDGSTFPVEIQARSVPWKGKMVRVTCVRDITERWNAEAARRRSEELFRGIVQDQTEMIVRWKPDGTRTFVNEALCRAFGRSPEKMIGHSFFPELTEEDREALERRIASLTPAQPIATSSHCSILPDGRRAWHEWTDRGFFDTGGRLVELQSVGHDITEQKKAEEARRRSEELFRGIVQDQTEMIVRWKPEGTRTFVNEAYCRTFGRTAEQVVGTSIFSDVSEDVRELIRRKLATLTPALPVVTSVHSATLPSGNIAWYEWTDHGFFDAAGRLVELQSVGRDITAQKAAEEARQHSEELFRGIVRDQTDMIVRWKPDGTRTFVNEAYSRMFGGSPKELIGSSFFPLIVEQDREAFERKIASLTPARRIATDIRRSSLADGTLAWHEWTDRAFFDAEGRLTELQSVGRDITERVYAEHALQESERRYRDFIQHSREGVWRLELEQPIAVDLSADEAAEKIFRHAYVAESNDAMGQILGLASADQIAGKRLGDIPFLADAVRLDAIRDSARGRWQSRTLEFEATDAAGNQKFLLRTTIPIVENGKLLRIWGITRDVTELRRAEEALRTSEERFRLLFQRNLAGVIKTAADGTILECNEALARIYGYGSRREILSVNAKDLYFDESEREDLLERLREQKNVIGVELHARRKDGSAGWVLESASMIEDEKDGPAFLATVVDITRMKELSEQLRQAQKMEAVGKLAAGVAHDFNNMLQIINGYSELLLDQLPAPNLLRDDVQQIKDIVDRAASLTRQLLAFSRQQVLAPQLLDLNDVVGNLNQMLRRLIGEDIELAMVKGRALYPITADPGQIQQVIINLAINARDAMPRGGTLMIETSNVEVTEEYARSHYPMPAGSYVRLVVSDSGSGMDQDTQSRIFEPFFTTKEKGKGTGLGLATAYGIIKQSGGYIWAQSQVGQGTTFQIYLPPAMADSQKLALAAPAAEAQAAKGSETVLLVEDETSVRSLVRRALEAIGYTVLEASNGPDALHLFDKHRGGIQLLMTDVVLPGMSGRELAERLTPLDEKMKILYMSGYTNDAILRHGVLSSGAVLLQKPFTRDLLANTVREILDRA